MAKALRLAHVHGLLLAGTLRGALPTCCGVPASKCPTTWQACWADWMKVRPRQRWGPMLSAGYAAPDTASKPETEVCQLHYPGPLSSASA